MLALCRCLPAWVCTGIFLFAGSRVFAWSPHLGAINPVGGQRGSELQLICTGQRLQDTLEIVTYEPGIEVKRFLAVSNKVVRAQIKIAPDCALGEHHLRLRTASGVSELRTFSVGPFPVVAEVEPNNLPAQAQRISLNTTVAGVVTAEDVDWFSFDAKKGELISLEVVGMRLGRGPFDPRLQLLGPNDKVLADVDDTWLATQDPFISLVAPAEGRYLIQLREATYAGGPDCHYLLHVGSFPRPTAVYPLGGKAGEMTAFTFHSDAADDIVQPVKLPGEPQEKFGLFAEQNQVPAPTPNWIRISDFPNILSPGAAPDREHAAVVDFPPPFALNGAISSKDEEDWFRFPAVRGTPLEVKVYARQLRSPLDSVIEVFDARGRSLASNDDAVGADSALKFTPSDSTNYFVRIRDTLGRFGRDFTYRMEITPAAPRIAVKIPEVARNDSQARQFIAVPRGNRFATLISAKRENLGGQVHFELPDLPPGITLSSDSVSPNVDAAPLVFEAAPDAAIGGRLADLIAVGTNANGRVTGRYSQTIELVQGPNNTGYYSTSVDKICVAVVKEAPFQIRIVEPKVPLVQAGSMALEVVAERKLGFTDPIELQMVWNPPGVSSDSEATIAGGATNVLYRLNAADGAEAGTWKIAVLAHAQVDGGEVYVSSQLAPLQVAAPFLAGKMQNLVTHPGETGHLRVDLQQLKPFSGSAKLRLLGLPDRISAPTKEITKDDQKVIFDLTVDPKCPTGPIKNVFCSADVVENGEVIPHTIASGGVVRIVPVRHEGGKLASAETKK